MRIFALSDIHVDFDGNAAWVASLSSDDYRDDVLILAGDVSDSVERLEQCLGAFASRFRRVFFVPGNHDLWVIRDAPAIDSLDKFEQVARIVEGCGATMRAGVVGGVSIVPLLGWYDGSFGLPGPELSEAWMDFHACRWPAGWTASRITEHFIGSNAPAAPPAGALTITFSHFLPRIDLMPDYIPPARRMLYPVLGSSQIETLIRRVGPDIHVYGHSHVNRDVSIDGIRYVNNAFGYPHETRITQKALKCIHEAG
ncbi:metallophosphoesterase [Burkholderia glumae]|uniref:metallophosphoesterase family protein n=1 Tax=Burkholderia glumae TaxID=337 RepID=UPI000C2811B2|nr:metallophosphoesterase [Burkholderia glumae]MCM2552100.1 metallophosphatase family protein [Burkholderia glumae]MCQ0034640.1 metallophosphatase family protein [Burkholderia glumae]MCQ0040192.1 metallophosphatase family protein [Burkholderia glumae]MCR1767137.1 metallophosphoesterase [Burkholderia glumae]NVE24931.1 metallophosphoesterase [Burkholderia glumae]